MITHICLICQDLMYLSCVTDIQYWQIKPSKKGSHTNARMILNVLYIVVLYKHSAFAGLYRNVLSYWKFLSLPLNEFLQSEIIQKLLLLRKKALGAGLCMCHFTTSLSLSVSLPFSLCLCLFFSLCLCLSLIVTVSLSLFLCFSIFFKTLKRSQKKLNEKTAECE